MANAPRGREKNISGQGKDINRRGEGLGTGPVGSGNAGSRVNGSGPARSYTPAGSGGQRASSVRKRPNLLTILIIVVAVIVLFKMFGGSGSSLGSVPSVTVTATPTPAQTTAVSAEDSKPYGYSGYGSGYGSGYNSGYSTDYSSLYGNYYSGYSGGSSVSSSWTLSSNTGSLNNSVSSKARAKYTKLKGNGKDTVTVMVYMCGTDLESQSGMGTADLQEMASATISENVNILVYTGGCRAWKTNGISSSVNQIYKMESGRMITLESDMGKASMTAPSTLSKFIQYCADEYPAGRYELIMWDHGGGTLSGFGYDEKYSSTDSLTLVEINEALKAGGVKFDFIGFDACLMGTAETALTLAPYADYLIASEESEPGIGWYYTNWITSLSNNTSIPTPELAKKIVDDFVNYCGKKCPGQAATLSVTDLAELQKTLPAKLTAFAASITELIDDDNYQTVSNARSKAREFSSSNRLDQVDLVSFAAIIGNDEANALTEAVLSAVKYNNVSSNMSDSYGLSVYFPYKKLSSVDTAVRTLEALNLDSEYIKCIQSYASMQTAGQAVSGGTGSSLYSLFGSYYGDSYSTGSSSGTSGSSSYSGSSGSGYSSGSNYYSSGSSLYDYFSGYGSSSYGSSSYSSSSGTSSSSHSSGSSSSGSSYVTSSEDIYSTIFGLLTGDYSGISGLNSSNSSYLGRSLDAESSAAYVIANRFDATALVWQLDADGNYIIPLSDEQWGYVQDLELGLLYDDGEGFIDMGLDNIFEISENGELSGYYDGTWLAINDQPVVYYHESTYDNGDYYCITGRVPCLLNGLRADLILVFDSENPYGFVAGARRCYKEGETETVAKSMYELQPGDVIDFVCDYYTYDGAYIDSWCFGEQLTIGDELVISNVYIDADSALPMYVFTDLYQQQYWTPVLP